MSKESNNQGRAYEYACLVTLEKEIQKLRSVRIEKNSSFYSAERAWGQIGVDLREMLLESATSAVETIFDLEPLILEDSYDVIDLSIQTDDKGEEGDVRDILITRSDIQWEIGLSVKHNHFAVKHSRLSKGLDFGEKWFGVKCSNKYWEDIKPIFDYLEKEKINGTKWHELPSKEVDVYIPLLSAFVNEVKRSAENYSELPRKMVEYLLGEYDFYKVISIDKKRITQIQAFNLRGTLSQPSKEAVSKILVPISSLPTRIVSLDFKPDSNNTVELYMDGGWQFSFRIHNASTKVETSLKFDVQIIGMPSTIISINSVWR